MNVKLTTFILRLYFQKNRDVWDSTLHQILEERNMFSPVFTFNIPPALYIYLGSSVEEMHSTFLWACHWNQLRTFGVLHHARNALPNA